MSERRFLVVLVAVLVAAVALLAAVGSVAYGATLPPGYEATDGEGVVLATAAESAATVRRIAVAGFIAAAAALAVAVVTSHLRRARAQL